MAETPLGSAASEIISKCNILDVISPLVPLKKSGSNYKACCPFHKEKTPSFTVSESKQIFHCFGCGASGDAISFVMKYYNLTFPEAVERLAAQYGVVIPRRKDTFISDSPVYYELNRKAAKYYLKTFYEAGNPGMEYMKKRGIELETLRAFGIGYADQNWQGLTDELEKQGCDMRIAEELGLIQISSKNNRRFDYFRERIIFPIVDTRRRVIGFGGRLIGDGEPKYLNSKDSRAFHKGSNLFGLNLARSEIQKEGFAFLVEGYMDVMGLYQAGVRNSVASLGTALTENQARLLKRYTKKAVICYDADQAGTRAALRGIDVLRASGFEIKVMKLEGAKDPDEFARKFGREAFLKRAEEGSLGDVDYRVEIVRKDFDLGDTSDAVKFYKAVAGILRGLAPVEAEIYIKKIAKNFGISEGALRREVQGVSTGRAVSRTFEADGRREEPAPEADAAKLLLEKTLLRLALLESEYFKAFSDYPEAAVSGQGEEIAAAMRDIYSEGEDFELDVLSEGLSEEARRYLAEISSSIQVGDSGTAYRDCLNKLEINRIEKRSKEIMDILSIAGEGDRTDDLMVEFSSLQAGLKELKR